ncbi:MAG TPA: hypothetical protein VH853_16335 [Polyangia bacterium]|jgi:hypothetical protein|nr:hypothetical protein [Polyangia bacterium]
MRNLVAILLAGALGACTSQAAGTGTGGSGGTGTTTGTGGTTSTGSGGGGGASSSAVACNEGPGNFAPVNGVACPPAPSSGLITDFSVSADAGVPDGGATQARFGDDSTTLTGGESTYANAPATLTSSVAGGDWHLQGMISNFAGFSLYFDNVPVNGMPCNMVDASAYTGISFKIWGTSGGGITMGMGIVDDTPVPSWFSSVTDGGSFSGPGSCIPNANGQQYYHPGCADPTAPAINIPSTAVDKASAQPVTLTWADFVGGACKANVLPGQIVSIYWQFVWSTTMAPYSVDMHIDDLTFTK